MFYMHSFFSSDILIYFGEDIPKIMKICLVSIESDEFFFSIIKDKYRCVIYAEHWKWGKKMRTLSNEKKLKLSSNEKEGQTENINL